jgi:putative hydrolase of the HAD superfamily
LRELRPKLLAGTFIHVTERRERRPPRGILFDLDGTLFDRDAAVRELVLAQHGRFAAALAHVSRDTYVTRVLELDAGGYGNKTTLYERVAKEFALSKADGAALLADFWATYHDHCNAFPDTLGTLTYLRARGFRLGIVTNGAVHLQEGVIQRLGLSGFMDAVLISEREGVRKPEREIFERGLRALELRAEEAWFVGDHPEADVWGAGRAGLTAVWRRSARWSAPKGAHAIIDTLTELLPMVRHDPS